METLGSRIAHYRNLKGLSQAKLAKACGWASQSRIGNYEKDTREPTLDDIQRIAGALEITISALIDPHEERSDSREPLAEVAERAAALAVMASKRSQLALERIAEAANQGRLSESDLVLLETIAARLESAPVTVPRPHNAGSHKRLRDKLTKDDRSTEG